MPAVERDQGTLHHPVRRLLVVGLATSSVAAVVLVLAVTAGAPLGLVAVLPPLFVVVANRGLVSSNATVLGVERGSRAAGSASAVLGACMFGGGVLVTPLVGLGPEGSPVPMALVVAGGAVAALVATVPLTRARTTVPVPQV
jgi:DHA1 family bicyclomycin/chloramphenicol resistance-like MFS transporter